MSKTIQDDQDALVYLAQDLSKDPASVKLIVGSYKGWRKRRVGTDVRAETEESRYAVDKARHVLRRKGSG